MISLNKIKGFLLAAVIGSMSVGFTACNDDDEPLIPGTGIEEAQWAEINDVNINGQTAVFEFDAPASWRAAVAPEDEEWVSVLTESGPEGLSSLRVKVAPNEGDFGRQTTISLHVSGYAEPCIITLRQGEGILERGNGRYRKVNEEIYDYMAERYLWNEHIPELALDYTIDYPKFLNKMLEGIAKFDNVNAEDGHWVDGQRSYWYSYIDSSAPVSKAVGGTNTDSGLLIMGASVDTAEGTELGFAVLWCTPGSPADAEGIKRGHYITSVNNIDVTMDNFQDLGGKVLNGNCTVGVYDIEFSSQGVATLTLYKEVFIGKYSYQDPSIYASKVITTQSGKKVGYISHMGFHMNFDSQVIDVFRQFKEAGIDDLIIDLRYNNGGHVLSSTVLGTLVAGTPHQGEVYVRTTYNSTRAAAGDVGEYKIGVAANPEQTIGYDKIPEALTQSLGLDKVYVLTSEYTASASELVINGLRGLGLTVNTIGLTTNGKNVGMEGCHFTYLNYSFDFYPITFYCENAKGFKDYANGIKADFEYDDSRLFPSDFGTQKDAYTYYALKWIDSGSKPNVSMTSRSAKSNFRPLPMNEEMKSPLTRRIGGNIQWRGEITIDAE